MTKRLLIILGMVFLLAAIAAACSDTSDLEDRIATLEASLQEQVQSLNEGTQRVAILTALDTLQAQELHMLEEDIRLRGEVQPGAAGRVEAAMLTVAATDWPDELQVMADDLKAKLQALADAFDMGDVAAIKPVATAAHDAWHDLDREARAYLGEAVGLETGDGTPDGGMNH